MRIKIAVLTALVLVSGLLQGCWNYRELDSMSVVAGMAVDRGQEGHKYHLTLDIADTSGAGKDKPVSSKFVESEGDTIFDAVRNAAKHSGLIFHWANCQIAIISRDVADESILPVVDFLMRDAEPRLTMELFVSEESTAKETLETQPTVMSIKSFEIDRIYEQNEKQQPVASFLVLHDIYNTLASAGRELALPTLRHIKNEKGETCEISGMTLFRKDRLAGFLTAEDSKFAMFVMDRIKGGVLNVKAPTGNTIAALEVFGNKTTVMPVVENGKVRFIVHTETDVALNELDEIADVTDQELRNGFEAAAEMQLKESIDRIIGIVQEQYGLDIFGFGDALHKSDPGMWYQEQENWGEIFKTLQVDVSCKINIRNSGQRSGPVKVGS